MRILTCLALTLLAVVPAIAEDVTPDEQLRYNRDTYHPVTDILKEKRGTVTDEQLEALKEMPLEAIWGAVRSQGYRNCQYVGLKATRPEARMVGRALTIRYLPRRPDLVEAMQQMAKAGDWPAGYNSRAAEDAKPGDVFVVDLGGEIEHGIFFGDVSALGAQMSGAVGAILYGSTRDLGELKEMPEFPVFANGFHPNAAHQVGVDWNTPVRVGGVTVLPGDVVVAEEEAVLFFPPHIAGKVIERARAIVDKENFERTLLRTKKFRFRDVYPLNAALQKKYEELRQVNQEKEEASE